MGVRKLFLTFWGTMVRIKVGKNSLMDGGSKMRILGTKVRMWTLGNYFDLFGN